MEKGDAGAGGGAVSPPFCRKRRRGKGLKDRAREIEKAGNLGSSTTVRSTAVHDVSGVPEGNEKVVDDSDTCPECVPDTRWHKGTKEK